MGSTTGSLRLSKGLTALEALFDLGARQLIAQLAVGAPQTGRPFADVVTGFELALAFAYDPAHKHHEIDQARNGSGKEEQVGREGGGVEDKMRHGQDMESAVIDHQLVACGRKREQCDCDQSYRQLHAY